jgi:hypothetical protein
MDLSRQYRLLLVAISVYADNCYDRINHIIMSLLLLALTGEQGPIESMLKPIQQMKFNQRKGRGDSSTYMGGRAEDNPLQGLCQGNGTAPACWIMVSLLMMLAYCREGHVSTLISPISKGLIKFMSEIYVDNADLLTMAAGKFDKNWLLQRAQANLNKWAELLNATATHSILPNDTGIWSLINTKWNNGSTIMNPQRAPSLSCYQMELRQESPSSR